MIDGWHEMWMRCEKSCFLFVRCGQSTRKIDFFGGAAEIEHLRVA